MFRNLPDQSRALKSRVKILFRSFSIEVNLFKLQMKKKYMLKNISLSKSHKQWSFPSHGHAKTQTADRAEHADYSDHANRAHFAREFRLLQLARHWQIHSRSISQLTSKLTWPKFPTSHESEQSSTPIQKPYFLVKFNSSLQHSIYCSVRWAVLWIS